MPLKPIFFFSLIGLLAAFALYNGGGGNVAVGSVAPDFELKDPDGKLVRLSDFRGKFVFLNFWATWCEPCVDEMPAMMTLNETLKDRDFHMLAVSVDTSWEVIEEFLRPVRAGPADAARSCTGGQPGPVQGNRFP